MTPKKPDVPPVAPLTELDRYSLERIEQSADSPIEAALLANLFVLAIFGVGARLRVRTPEGGWIPELPGREEREWVVIELHPEIEGLKPDIAIGIGATQEEAAVSVLIECDGHDFHEKTKEQVRRDKQRDRKLALAGFHVLRFAGSEIHKDPMACAKEVFSHLLARLEDGFAVLDAQKKEPGDT